MRRLLVGSFVATLPISAQDQKPTLFNDLSPHMKQTFIAQVSATCPQSSPGPCTNSASGDAMSFLTAFGGSTYDASGNVYIIVTNSTSKLQTLNVIDPSGAGRVLGTLPNTAGGSESNQPVCTQNGTTATLDAQFFPAAGSFAGMFGVNPPPFPFFLETLPKNPISYNQAVNALYVFTAHRIDTYQTTDSNFCATGNGSIVSETNILALVKITSQN